MIKNLYGIWAGKNSELVFTSKFIMFFAKKENEMLSYLIPFTSKKDSFKTVPKAIAVFRPEGKKVMVKYRNSKTNIDKVKMDNLSGIYSLKPQEFHIQETSNQLLISNSDGIFIEVLNNSGKMGIIFDNTKYEDLEQIEALKILNQQPNFENANSENIGKCLKQWSLASGIGEDDNSSAFGAEVNTNNHSYTFMSGFMNENEEIIYCRAARIKYTNQGTVFAQNIRMMKNPQEFTTNIFENNLERSKMPIDVDYSKFNPNSCTFTETEAIYWSLKDFNESLITLNGCGGQEYKTAKPQKDADADEWFEYKD